MKFVWNDEEIKGCLKIACKKVEPNDKGKYLLSFCEVKMMRENSDYETIGDRIEISQPLKIFDTLEDAVAEYENNKLYEKIGPCFEKYVESKYDDYYEEEKNSEKKVSEIREFLDDMDWKSPWVNYYYKIDFIKSN